MATRADVRRIALALPEVREAETDFAFSVPIKDKLKGFAWVWKERIDPKKPRVPNPAVLAIRVANVGQRNVMIAAEPNKFFTEPHYEGFPAVLVRIAEVSVAEMRMLLEEGWRCMAPPALQMGTATTQRRGAETQRAQGKTKNKKRVATPEWPKRPARRRAVKSKSAKPKSKR